MAGSRRDYEVCIYQAVARSWVSEVQLRGQARSQVQLGNEGEQMSFAPIAAGGKPAPHILQSCGEIHRVDRPCPFFCFIVKPALLPDFPAVGKFVTRRQALDGRGLGAQRERLTGDGRRVG